MFLSNNVKFGSLNEVITFIDNVIHNETRKYKDIDIIDENITTAECWYKIMSSCGFHYIPSKEDLLIVWEIICKLSQEDLNRLYYKNNLYSFIENSTMTMAITYLLQSLNLPFLDPNKAPKEIKVELDEFCDILMEYVYYPHQIIDRLDHYRTMNRNVAIITDTDSVMASFDAWYRCILEKVKDIPMDIARVYYNPIKLIEADEFGDRPLINPIRFVDEEVDYDFFTDETIEMERLINPIEFLPQDSLKFSIINIMAYCMSNILNDYMKRYTMNSNSYEDGKKCLLIMKNEFLFKRILLTEAMKNYASAQLLQEGNIVPENKRLDVKGLAMSKSSTNNTTQEKLKEILYEEILNADAVDQINVLKQLAKFEKEIYESLRTGKKTFYKPVRIKSISSYENPMRVYGIKQCLVWNVIKGDNDISIDLEERNFIDIVKIDINPKNIHKLKDSNPNVYDKLLSLMNEKEFALGIEGLAVPRDSEIPKYIVDFIDYTSIINDNLKLFPLESIGLFKGSDNNNYTNIISL